MSNLSHLTAREFLALSSSLTLQPATVHGAGWLYVGGGGEFSDDADIRKLSLSVSTDIVHHAKPFTAETSNEVEIRVGNL